MFIQLCLGNLIIKLAAYIFPQLIKIKLIQLIWQQHTTTQVFITEISSTLRHFTYHSLAKKMNFEGVLKPYKDKIENAKLFFTFNRDPYSGLPLVHIHDHDHSYYPNTQVFFFDYLLECEFIDPTYIRCPLCKGQMQLNINSSKADGVRWECKSIKKKKETDGTVEASYKQIKIFNVLQFKMKKKRNPATNLEQQELTPGFTNRNYLCQRSC